MLMRLLFNILRWLDEETMVTAFLELHDDVEEAGGAAPAAFGQGPVVPGENPSARAVGGGGGGRIKVHKML